MVSKKATSSQPDEDTKPVEESPIWEERQNESFVEKVLTQLDMMWRRLDGNSQQHKIDAIVQGICRIKVLKDWATADTTQPDFSRESIQDPTSPLRCKSEARFSPSTLSFAAFGFPGMSSSARKRPKSKHRSPSPSTRLLPKEPSSSLFPSKQDLPKLLAVIGIAASVAFACNYTISFFNRFPKPLCDSANVSDSSPDPSLSDFCEPCPSNGKCSEGKLECLPGYRRYGRICVEDGEINQTAKKLSEWVESHVCEAYARFLCDGTGTIWFQKADILKELDEFESKGQFPSKDDSFMYAKEKAMEIKESSLEARTGSTGCRQQFLATQPALFIPCRTIELKCPDWLAEQYKPLLCCIRQWLSEHALLIWLVFVLVMGRYEMKGFMKIFLRHRRRRYLSSRAEKLYEQVCDILEENALMAKTKGEGEPWVVASRIRDHLLLPKERKDTILWRKVEELIQEDSRLDQYPKLVKGESKVVWEWQVEGSLSSKTGAKGIRGKMHSTEDIPHHGTAEQRNVAVTIIRFHFNEFHETLANFGEMYRAYGCPGEPGIT
ncbi:hypothetical protein ACLOJK_033812 [Asimina triloba]